MRPAPGSAAWLAVAGTLAAAALIGGLAPHEALDWQPGLVTTQPWRAFTAVAVHYSAQHLAVNLLGIALAAVFGLVAQVPARLAIAWLCAWPLTQIGLRSRPELLHYGGLSGVLHAGVAIVVVWVLASASTTAQRWVGAAVGLGLVAKVLGEAPWGPVLRHPAGWDIAVAPLAHATGTLAGLACAALALIGHRAVRTSAAVRQDSADGLDRSPTRRPSSNDARALPPDGR